jgi:hypothetical protein
LQGASCATCGSASRPGTSPPINDPVRLTIVPTEFEAEVIQSLLGTEGIESLVRQTDLAVGASDASFSSTGPFEILVAPESLEAARELIARE